MTTDNPYASPAAESSAERLVVKLEPPQSVEFHNTAEDIGAVSDKVFESLPSYQGYLKRHQRIYCSLTLALALIAVLLYSADEGFLILVIGTGGMSITFAYLAIRLPQLARRNQKKINKQIVSNESAYLLDKVYTVTLFDEGIQIADSDGHGFRKWQSISLIDTTDVMLFVFTTPSQAIGIPLRAFFNEASFKGFCQLGERLWKEAQSDVEPLNH